jgi:hypothetical protein
MTAPEMKQVNDFLEVNCKFPKNDSLNFFDEKYIQFIDASDSSAVVRVAPEDVVIKTASYTLNATTATPTAIVDASLHVAVSGDSVYGYAIIEAGTGFLTVKVDATANTTFSVIQPGQKEILPVLLGTNGVDLTVNSSVASDVIKVTLASNKVDLDVNSQFVGAE